eukprot:scaffold15611_cov110-Isochrysis_galbana.AAC.2
MGCAASPACSGADAVSSSLRGPETALTTTSIPGWVLSTVGAVPLAGPVVSSSSSTGAHGFAAATWSSKVTGLRTPRISAIRLRSA